MCSYHQSFVLYIYWRLLFSFLLMVGLDLLSLKSYNSIIAKALDLLTYISVPITFGFFLFSHKVIFAHDSQALMFDTR